MPYHVGPGAPVLKIGTNNCTESESDPEMFHTLLACSLLSFDEAAGGCKTKPLSSHPSLNISASSAESK